MSSVTERLYWCNSHRRRATGTWKGLPCCESHLGGIMIPCDVVDLTDEVELVESDVATGDDIVHVSR